MKDTLNRLRYWIIIQKMNTKNLVWVYAIVKYTVGLPGVIMSAIRGEDTTRISAGKGSAIQSLSKDEKKMAEMLNKMISLNVNDKDGYVQLSASLGEPLAVAQLAERAQELLQTYITDFKIEKVKSNLTFVEQQYDAALKALRENAG